MSKSEALSSRHGQRNEAPSSPIRLLTDMKPLFPVDQVALLTDESAKAAFKKVFTEIIDLLPGAPWVRLTEMNERFALWVGIARNSRKRSRVWREE
jgi:hypothetical protein